MWKHIASNALTFFIVLLFLGAGAIAWGVREYSAEGPLEQAICVRVPSGSTMGRVSDNLAEQGAVRSQVIFDIGVDYAEAAQRLKAGSWLVPERSSMEEILDIVTRGGASTCGTQVRYIAGIGRVQARVRELDPATDQFIDVVRFDMLADEYPPEYLEVREESDTQYQVQVIEGTTVWEVVTALNALEVLGDELEELPPEGMLAPDLYDFNAGDNVGELVDLMVSRQVARLSAAWAERDEGLPFSSADEALVLASIIEKETAIAEERPLVSSVLVNRIRQDWRLQFDPTIIYGITRGQEVLERPISNADIAGTTEFRRHGAIEYNTYQIDGLPAGPIANPGEAAIRAAVAPAETDLMFFAADGSGGHAFAETLAEHNANVERLRALEAEARDNDG